MGAGALVVAAVLLLAGPAPSAGDTLRIAEWLIAGPLPVGSREALIDPLAGFDLRTYVPQEGDSLPSWMAPDGWTRWSRKVAEGEALSFDFEATSWDALADQWGIAGILCAGLAFGRLEIERPGVYLLEAPRVGSFTIDGRRFLGDPYGQGFFRVPVSLEAGSHPVFLRVGGAGPRQVSFRATPARTPIAVLEGDLTLPDLVAGEKLEGWGAAPIVNASGREIRGATLRFGDGTRVEEVRVGLPALPPEMILKVPFRVRTLEPPAAGERSPQKIRVEWEGRSFALACSLRVRGPRDSRIETFVSRQDDSVQRYAVLPPAAGGREPYAMILSLHGASVEPEPQVRSYTPKDWAVVVAATNTRPYGFDWQDWGRVNAIEALEAASLRFPIDPDRVLLTGHSMGGHGVWHVGLAHADRFAALAPSAGWATFATYVPYTLRRDATEADPRLRAIWERAIAPDNVLAHMPNALGKPVFVLHGADDDNVPVFHGRMLAQRSREAGAEVVYREVVGMGHWWDRPETPGVDCVDDSVMMEFLRAARRPDSPAPRITLRSADLSTCDRLGWVRVDAAPRRFDRMEVDAELRGEKAIRISTRGVAGITLDLDALFGRGARSRKLSIEIDGARLDHSWKEGSLSLRREKGDWRRVEKPEARAGDPGPIKAAFQAPFVLVYGTGGSAEENEAMRRLAVLDAQHWYLRADGYAPVLPDTALADRTIGMRNLILYALPGTNRQLERIAAYLPIRVARGAVEVGKRRIAGSSLAVRFVARHPRAPGRLVEVVAGTDLAGLSLASASNPCGSGTGYPDFIVYDGAVRTLGWAGLLAAGFWTPAGELSTDEVDSYIR